MASHPMHLGLLALERGRLRVWAQGKYAALHPTRLGVEANLPNGFLDAALGVWKVGAVGVQNAHGLKPVKRGQRIPVP